MNTRDWKWTSHDGLEMYAQVWEPEENPKAVVCLVHGLGEHTGRYAHVGKAFAEEGFALAGFDLQGHGKSSGPRGHIPSLATVMGDIQLFCQQLEERYPGIPQFLYGHSMGGFLVLAYATFKSNTLRGVIATGPALRTPVLEQKFKIGLAKVLGSFMPTMTISTGLEVSFISRDPQVVRAYQEDPLVHGMGTLAAAQMGLDAVDWAFAHAPDFPVPLLLLHGSEDKIAYLHGSQEFANLVPSNCTLKFWEGLYHEIHNEPEQKEVFAFMIDWMNSQLQ
jgi:acylglycerol lipase